jgi:hypothetical protein
VSMLGELMRTISARGISRTRTCGYLRDIEVANARFQKPVNQLVSQMLSIPDTVSAHASLPSSVV